MILHEFFKELAAWFHGWSDPLLDYLFLGEWWLALVALVAVCMVIGYFADFKWVKAVLGVLILIAGAFVVGGTAMWRHLERGKKKQDG